MSNEKTVCDTWGAKKNADSWDLILEFDYNNKSIREHNNWYAETLKNTLEAFSSLAKAYAISFDPIYSIKDNPKGVTLIKQENQSYDNYTKTIFEVIKQYPADIDSINIGFDFFVYVRTEKSFPKPTRIWIREFGESNDLGGMLMQLSIEDEEAGILFSMNHTLFYPFSYPTGEDNTELFELNRPLLEGALRNWEQKLDGKIEVDGLKGIYEYGFLPEDQW
ncbi:MAG: hypothetical protein AAF383_01280 [Cyanobacteria bacterium P01_A01_bin.83]